MGHLADTGSDPGYRQEFAVMQSPGFIRQATTTRCLKPVESCRRIFRYQILTSENPSQKALPDESILNVDPVEYVSLSLRVTS
jgi:hypothetical protein